MIQSKQKKDVYFRTIHTSATISAAFPLGHLIIGTVPACKKTPKNFILKVNVKSQHKKDLLYFIIIKV